MEADKENSQETLSATGMVAGGEFCVDAELLPQSRSPLEKDGMDTDIA